MKKFIAVFLLCGMLGFQSIHAMDQWITAKISTTRIEFLPGGSQKNLQYPLLSYEDHLYLSLRDFAKLANQEVIWREENDSVCMVAKAREQWLVKDRKTAETIARAIVLENFPDDIDEDTRFIAWPYFINRMGARNGFYVYVVNDPSVTIEDFDKQAIIKVNVISDTGECSIEKRDDSV